MTVAAEAQRLRRFNPNLIRISLALLSFALYCTAALLLNQGPASNWTVEQEPMIAAASHVKFGAPIGRFFGGVQDFMHHAPGSTRDKIEQMAEGGGPARPGTLEQWVLDGNGVGYILFATTAMSLFGLHVASLLYLFLAFASAGTLCFVLRFRDQRLLFVPLLFTALTVMMLTPVVAGQGLDEAPIGGARYFIVAGFLPALHLIFALLERGKAARGWQAMIAPGILLVIQSIILAWTFFIRASASGLILAVAIAALYSLWSVRRDRAQVRAVFGKGLLCVVVAAVTATTLLGSMPRDYRTSGRAFPVVWHRAFLSFGAHPDWPFPGLREKYDCTWAPSHRQGLIPGIQDADAHCVWFAANAGGTESNANAALFNRDYERSLRNAVFYVVTHYPRQTLQLMLYYKPLLIVETLGESLNLSIAPSEPAVLMLVFAQCLLLAGFTVLGCVAFGGNGLCNGLILCGFAVLALPQYFVAWARSYTATDIVLDMFALIALGYVTVVQQLALRSIGIRLQSLPSPEPPDHAPDFGWMLARRARAPAWAAGALLVAAIALAAYYGLTRGSQSSSGAATSIAVRSATYGENCGAPRGNVTSDAQMTCDNERSCVYTVDVVRLGDPAPHCSKNFSVDYACVPGGTSKTENIEGEAGLGKSVTLSCGTGSGAAPATAAAWTGIRVLSATYGGNCQAPIGNATSAIGKSCDTKNSCDYTVDVAKLGDPAHACAKSFFVKYQCGGETTARTAAVPPEAGLGGHVRLACP